MAFKQVAVLDELWEGEMKGIIVDGIKVLLINTGNTICAFEDRCLHQAVELSKGIFEKGVITCPTHHWQYDTTGCGINPKGIQLKAFAIKLSDGNIFVDVNQILHKKAGDL